MRTDLAKFPEPSETLAIFANLGRISVTTAAIDGPWFGDRVGFAVVVVVAVVVVLDVVVVDVVDVDVVVAEIADLLNSVLADK